MVAQVGALRVAVGADITGLQTGMKRAERQVQASAGVMQKAVTGINKSFAGLGTVAGFSLGAAGLMAGASAFLRVADAAKTMAAQLKLATAEYGSYTRATKDVQGIAERSRASLTATAELYATIQRNAGELGNTQEVTARVTETISKSFAVFGATAMQAEQATRQLIQAFQSGRLSGDEFRSMMENAPRLMKMLADSLGVTTGQLREMSKEGELTADKLLAAFSDIRLTEELDKEFAQMPVTFDQAMTQLYNSAVVTFSAFDRGGQFSNSIASFVQDGSKGFSELEQSAFDFGRNVSDLFAAFEVVREGIGNMHGDGIGAFSAMTDWSFTFRDALRDVLSILDSVIEAYAAVYNAPGNVLRGAFGVQQVTYDSRFAENFDEKTRDKRTGQERFGGLFRGGTGRTPPPFKAPPPKGAKAKKPKSARAKKPPRDRSEDVEYQFEKELLDAQMDILRAQQALAGTVGERAELSLKMMDLENQQFELELAEKVRRAQRDLAEGKITQTAFQAVTAHADALRAKHEEVDLLKRQALLYETALHRMERNDALTERQFQNQIDGLEFSDEMARSQEDHRRIQLEIVDALYKQKDAHLRALKAQLLFAGKIEEAADVQAEIDRLPTERARERERVRQGTMGPLEEWANSIPQTAREINEAFQSIQVQGLEGLSGAIADVITGTKSLKDAFGDLAKSIIADLIQMTVRMLIFRALSSVIGGAFGGGGISESGGVFLGGGGAKLGFATGGSFSVLGAHGRDRNMLSLNGIPIAKVSHGERVSVNDSQGGSGGKIIVELRGDIDARIAEGANIQIIRAAPVIQAGVMGQVREQRRRA
jgi:lambda family phage tail tape measure protein